MAAAKNVNGWNLTRSGSSEIYLEHIAADGQRQFVARFKYARPGVNATAFARFLVANFTPAEYFAQRETGKAPATILEAKGYVSPNVQRAREFEANRQRMSVQAAAAIAALSTRG